MHVSQMNVGTTLYDVDDPRMAGFMDNLDRINALADETPGFVWRLKGEGNDATDIVLTEDPRFIVNMSLWTSVEALFDYVYRSAHREIMVDRRQWFQKPVGPYQVLWWVEPGHIPTPQEGLERLAHLAQHGPTPYAFTFKMHFPPGLAAPTDLSPDPYCVGWS